MKSTLDLSFNWFDLCVLAMLIVGIVIGRKRGMSLELLSVLQWLVIVFVGAMARGTTLRTTLSMRKSERLRSQCGRS